MCAWGNNRLHRVPFHPEPVVYPAENPGGKAQGVAGGYLRLPAGGRGGSWGSGEGNPPEGFPGF